METPARSGAGWFGRVNVDLFASQPQHTATVVVTGGAFHPVGPKCTGTWVAPGFIVCLSPTPAYVT